MRKVMNKIANDISDSDFLLELKGMDDEDLKNPIQEAVALANIQLSFIRKRFGSLTVLASLEIPFWARLWPA